MAESIEDISRLELVSTIGFNGHVEGGLAIHPDRQHLIYPLGSTIVIRDLNSSEQSFLTGHTNNVSCIAISKSGKYIASGQVTHMGFKASVIVWDWEKRSIYCQLVLHKVKVEDLAFSPNDKFLVTLGGLDDGSVVVWNLETKDAVCGSPAAVQSAGTTYSVKYANCRDDLFVTGGDGTLRVWELDLANRKIRPIECNMGQLKRIVKCIEVDEKDQFFYCGTTSGDILKINMKTKLLSNFGPAKGKFSRGLADMKILKTGDILVGSGDGTVALVKGTGEKYNKLKSCKVEGSVTSIALRGEGHQIFAGTDKSQIYKLNFTDFEPDLQSTSHYNTVNDVAFAEGCSELFATCSKNDIRIWHTPTSRELLRITVPNMECSAVEFMKNGTSILSAWDDGKIRCFTPETGKQKFVINNAHNLGVTAIATTSDCEKIVSGGGEGQVRVWNVAGTFMGAMKEHKSSIAAIKIQKNNAVCVTASSDGTCIIWDLVRYTRKQMVMANTLFKCVCYHPKEFQIITAGSDRKMAYWETYDGSQIREVDGSLSGDINGMDVSPDGKTVVTGGNDKLVKVWGYDDAEVRFVGVGHSEITKLKICPNERYIVTANYDGSILVWRYPCDL
ncbi:cilia- and flagella-associated protein 52-like [Styela clava]